MMRKTGWYATGPALAQLLLFVLDLVSTIFGSFLMGAAVTWGDRGNFGPRPAEPTAWPEKLTIKE